MATKQHSKIARSTVEVINDWGLHARPAAAIAMLASDFNSEITINHGDLSASAQSVAALLMLEAVKGVDLTISAKGLDASEAVLKLVELFEQGFGEEHFVLKGQGTNCGTVIGAAHVLYDTPDDVPHYSIPKTKVDKECQRLSRAISEVRKEYNKLGTNKEDDPQVEAFKNLLLAMLQEDHVAKLPTHYIKKHLVNAEWALKLNIEQLTEQFLQRDDPVWQQRAEEYHQLLQRLVANMGSDSKQRARSKPGTRRIVVADSIGPAEVLEYYKAGYAGFVTSSGSFSSHAAILARGLGIAAIVAVDHKALIAIDEDELLALDSDASELHVKPGKEALARLRSQVSKAPKTKVKKTRSKKTNITRTMSRDGIRIKLLANIEFVEEIEVALKHGAEGIGLFRTEFLFLQNEELPSEDEQYELYRDVIKRLDGREVSFRTLDIGNDKMIGLQEADDSALGRRGIRLSLDQPEIFKPQLRALLRASKHGPMSIMLPMIGQVAEFNSALQFMHDTADELDIPQDQLPQLGSMVEIPGTAFIMRELASNCEFFSIGSNDLIQFTLAVDRNHAALADLASPCHPGVVSLLVRIIKEAQSVERPLTMCGELAADPSMVRLYCALGLRSLSMAPAMISEIRELLENYSIAGNTLQAGKIVQCQSLQQIAQMIAQLGD